MELDVTLVPALPYLHAPNVKPVIGWDDKPRLKPQWLNKQARVLALSEARMRHGFSLTQKGSYTYPYIFINFRLPSFSVIFLFVFIPPYFTSFVIILFVGGVFWPFSSGSIIFSVSLAEPD